MSAGAARRVTALLGLSLVLAAFVPAASAAPAAEAATPPARIRVAADNSYPPYFFVEEDGSVQGYEADLWRLFERHTGIRVDLLPMPWEDTQRAVLGGHADVLDMLFRTPQREQRFAFSDPYATVPVGIYVSRRIPGVHDVASLKGLPVGVERGDACAERLRQLGVQRLREYPGYRDMIRAAIAGDLGIFCSEEYPANYFLYQSGHGEAFRRAFVLYEGAFHRAVRKDDGALLRTIEQGMARITPAERAALKKKWLAPPDPLERWLHWAGLGVAVALAVVALLALWIWALGRSVRHRTRELVAGQAKLRAIFNASPDAVWMKDRDGLYRDCNERTLQLLGKPRGEVVGKRHADLYPGADLALVEDTDAQVLRDDQRVTYTLSVPEAAGGQRHFEIIKVPLHDADGGVEGLLGVARDISDRVEGEARLRLWAQAFERAAFGVAVFDARNATILMANPTFARERGYSAEEMAGMPLDALYPPELVEERRKAREAINRAPHSLTETEHVTRDGRRFPVLLDCSVTHDANGQAQHVVVYAQDISQRKQADSELRLAAVAFETLEAMVVLDAEGVIQRVNAAFTILTGFEVADVVGRSPAMLLNHRPGADDFERLWPQIQRESFWLGEQWVAVKQGQPRIVRLEVSAVPDEAGQVAHYVCAMTDLTSEREALARAEHLALFDPLTDLPNRSFLADRLQHMLADPALTTGALLLLDLDHFKRVNDLRGHSTGNQLLTFIAQRLRGLLGEADVLGRFGGGTFAILLPCTSREPEACDTYVPQFAERVRQALREPFWLGSPVPIAITVSIGWTELHPGTGHADTAIKEAELAMYAAKAAGRDRVTRFDPAMVQKLERQEALANDLLRAVGGDIGGLDLHYHLQIDREGRAVGAEALLRFTQPDGTRVGPDTFIPLAEENGLILPLGDWVLQRACQRLAAWATQPHTRGLALAINVSARQFVQPGFVEDVERALARSGADPSLLKLEITESTLLGDLEGVAAKLARLRALGIHISLDDFGTGYSSLAYLSRLPLDQLKIDRTFVSRLPEDGNDATVAQTIIGMARGLSLEVIAEGVETAAQRDFLVAHGCDGFQGYLFARPLPLADFERLLQEHYAPH